MDEITQYTINCMNQTFVLKVICKGCKYNFTLANLLRSSRETFSSYSLNGFGSPRQIQRCVPIMQFKKQKKK